MSIVKTIKNIHTRNKFEVIGGWIHYDEDDKSLTIIIDLKNEVGTFSFTSEQIKEHFTAEAINGAKN